MLSYAVLLEVNQKDRETRSENYAPASFAYLKKKKKKIIVETWSF